ncbi:hypothetical protein, conserved [Plasmodium gonderi]|uniref:CWC16 domain-containing protein n=1 Tax=Plasmodium gonderi TaxID=77519 RepID=A0A1Y1JN78_PLAGO|nr:hypothetical protein, conserved [Plasmodium gonderi]GAW83700.1 hypothetical protein, conserved [Plasmodium gonderi]
MLSLKASRADNFYYGNVDDELVKKKKEKEERKKKKKKEYNEIKFEIPYTIICGECKKYIYKGERFNSERREIGHYLSTPFYSFTISCKTCFNKIVIETNPKDCSYDVTQGARKKNEHFENVLTEAGRNNINSIDFEKNKKKKCNPFLLLEINALQKKKDNKGKESNRTQDKLVQDEAHESVHYFSTEPACYSGEEPYEGIPNEESPPNNENINDENINDENINDENINDENINDENINDVIKENYLRNNMLKNDFTCNRNLRKQLRDIKYDKIKQREEYKRKNIFIDIVNNPYENMKINKYMRFNEKCKKSINVKEELNKETWCNGQLRKHKISKNSLIKKKKSSIFDKKYLKKVK